MRQAQEPGQVRRGDVANVPERMQERRMARRGCACSFGRGSNGLPGSAPSAASPCIAEVAMGAVRAAAAAAAAARLCRGAAAWSSESWEKGGGMREWAHRIWASQIWLPALGRCAAWERSLVDALVHPATQPLAPTRSVPVESNKCAM